MPPTPTVGPVPAGHVISQEETSGRGPNGNYVPGVNVTAALDGSGTTFTVFVPKDRYTPQAVQAALEEQAAKVAAVHAITFGG